MLRYRILLLSLVLLTGWTELSATHIVGGELNYTCLGDNQYELTLTLYRDCFYGNPNAQFDDPASIGIFGANNELLSEILIPFMEDDTLSPVLINPCLVIPPDVCVHTTTYRTTTTLPPAIGGYTIAYQRCCRNQTILNIVEPLATGATYMVEISEKALLECNSSPKFQTWPPLYICAGEPIIFDQSATDADGDSIFYRLCTPLTGADPDFPQPQPPNNPPYEEITWVDPPYNVDNMLNGTPGDPPLTIDPVTGLLTGTPNTVGQFVVGICVEEYRDGELIGTLRRDFQYNVGICNVATAAFFTPEVQCGDLTVDFLNQSTAGNNYLWFFGDPADPTASSTEENPQYTYSDIGTYTITLISQFNESCTDTFQRTIQLLPESLFPDFSLTEVYCGDSLTLDLVDNSVDTLGEIVDWEWTINGDQVLNGPEQTVQIDENGQVTVLLMITSSTGCVASSLQTVQAELLDLPPLADTLFFCPGDSLFLFPAFNPAYNYTWTPATGLSDPTVGNPLADPDVTTTYTLLIDNPLNDCFAERTVTVVPGEVPELVVPTFVETCEDSLTLSVTSADAISILWSNDLDFSSTLAQGNSLSVAPQNEERYYVLARNAAGCISIDSIDVAGRAVDVIPTSEPLVCLGSAVGVSLLNADPVDTLTYEWAPPEGILAQTSNGIIVRPTSPGIHPYWVTITNQFGCTYQDTIPVAVFDTTGVPLLADYTQCTGLTVDFTSDDPNSIYYNWIFGPVSDPDAVLSGSMVTYTYPAAGTYTVQLAPSQSLVCVDTLELVVTVADPVLVPDISFQLADCTDSVAVLTLFNTSTVTGSTLSTVDWIINGDLVTDDQPTLNVAPGETVTATLILTTPDGCVDSLTQVIEPAFLPDFLPPELINCGDDGVFLNPDGPAEYTYVWSPGVGLSDPTAVNPLANPATDQLYSVTITDPVGGCVRVDEVLVEVLPAVEYSVSDDVLYCGGELTLTAAGPGTQLYIWSSDPEGQPVLHVGADFMPVAPLAPVYYLTVQTPDGCTAQDSVLIDNQQIILDYADAQTICVGDSTELVVFGEGLDAVTFVWSPAEGILAQADTPTPLVGPMESTTYTFSATNAAGCTETGSIDVNIFDFTPPLVIAPPMDTIVAGETITLMATDDVGYTYVWTPAATLDADDVPTVQATPEETTTYTLTITDPSGCVNVRTVTIFVLNTVCLPPFIYLPNAFSPNGDNRNDVLRVEGNLLEEVYLAIYDRWGELIYEGTDPATGWDGRHRGEDLPADVYAYVLRVRCVGGEAFETQGNVTLVR